MELETRPTNLPRVRPRVLDVASPEPTPILAEDAIERFVRARALGSVRISGPKGSGKSTALRAIADAFAGESLLVALDEPRVEEVKVQRGEKLVVYTARADVQTSDLARLEMAPWSRDELIEYVLAARTDRCASVIGRLQASSSEASLPGSPFLWSIVLDAMIDHDDLGGALDAIEAHIASIALPPERAEHYGKLCLSGAEWLSEPSSKLSTPLSTQLRAIVAPADARMHDLLQHAAVRTIVGGAHVARLLARGEFPAVLQPAIVPDLLERAGKRMSESAVSIGRLASLAAFDELEMHPNVIALLNIADPQRLLAVFAERTREGRGMPNLRRVHAPGAQWPALSVDRVNISGANLRGADLSGWTGERVRASAAKLERASLRQTKLPGLEAVGASLAGADLKEAQLAHARFESADLRFARLQGAVLSSASFRFSALDGAIFMRANLSSACFEHTTVERTRFLAANCAHASFAGVCLRKALLIGAVFTGAQLRGCDLERVSLRYADFMGADLSGALLTGSVLSGANLSRASLRGAGLADVNCERADLRDADFSHASFHMGSSRSGLVFHAPPMEGSRTGFYADEHRELDFKAPEEIRKANLRAADLRGAKIEDCDFYLVDLRGAQFTNDQRKYLARCGALLD
jgi:uncharacterized protein YjbI with pentapeptide repeats